MESSEPAPELSLIQRIRNTWEFSNLMQFIFTFGKAVKIDEDFNIEVRPFQAAHALSPRYKKVSLHDTMNPEYLLIENKLGS